jgi:CubicO group peptidase (beta-lactamase class C family)
MNPVQPHAAARKQDLVGERAQRLVEQLVEEAHVPGMALAVARPDRIVYDVAVGYADLAERRPATVVDQYPWFSLTKIATATAAMQLHVGGRLDVDAPIGTYLPGYRPHGVHGHPSTRQLLTHTAGLANPLPVRWVRPEHEPEDPDQQRRLLLRHGTPRHRVGTRARYSNIGYLLAGEVIGAVTGRHVRDVVSESVLRPLGTNATGFGFDPGRPRATGHVRMPATLRPALRMFLPAGLVGPRAGGFTTLRPFLVNGSAYGGLIGTVSDAALLAAAHVGSATDRPTLLPQAEIERMRTVTAHGSRFDHGTGWFRRPVDERRSPGFVEHYGTGGGFWNAMRIYPERRLAIVAMANTTAAWDVDRLFTALQELTWP